MTGFLKFNRIPCVAVMITLAGLTATCRADEPKGPAKVDHKLIGTWKLVSAKYGGKESSLPQSSTTLKHVTPTQFMWASYNKDGKVTRTAGGGYALNGENYEESPIYGFSSDFDIVGGKTHKFTCKVEGNKWYHNGALSSGLTIEEVWEREEKK